MSAGEGEVRPEDAAAQGDRGAQARIEEQMRERGAEDPHLVEDIPAGGAGADSGASEVVRVDPESGAGVKDQSVHNDEPGVGTRR